MREEDQPTAGGHKDRAHIDREWVVDRRLIDGVKTREVHNVVTANGITTELYRPDWGIVDGEVQQVIHVALRGHAVSAWHQHRERWDYIMVVGGHMRVVLNDLAGQPSSFVNLFDRPYDYEDPDEWRLPPDTDEIPYAFD